MSDMVTLPELDDPGTSEDDDVVHLCDPTVDPDHAFCGRPVDPEILPADAPDVNVCITCGAIALLRGWT